MTTINFITKLYQKKKKGGKTPKKKKKVLRTNSQILENQWRKQKL